MKTATANPAKTFETKGFTGVIENQCTSYKIRVK